MTRPDTRIETQRLILRSWRAEDLEDFTRLHGNPQTMRDHGVTLTPEDSARKLRDYRAQYDQHGIIRWAVTSHTGAFLGYTGIYPNGDDHPLGAHGDIGWRFLPQHWGQGYATEAARAALAHAFEQAGMCEVLAYTEAENTASQAVIARLPFTRDPSRDFTISDDHVTDWRGMVWVARAGD